MPLLLHLQRISSPLCVHKSCLAGSASGLLQLNCLCCIAPHYSSQCQIHRVVLGRGLPVTKGAHIHAACQNMQQSGPNVHLQGALQDGASTNIGKKGQCIALVASNLAVNNKHTGTNAQVNTLLAFGVGYRVAVACSLLHSAEQSLRWNGLLSAMCNKRYGRVSILAFLSPAIGAAVLRPVLCWTGAEGKNIIALATGVNALYHVWLTCWCRLIDGHSQPCTAYSLERTCIFVPISV